MIKNPSLHLIKQLCIVQQRIVLREKEQYNIGSLIKEDMQTVNHLVDELIRQVQIDCNEEDLNNEIKETLITGGA